MLSLKGKRRISDVDVERARRCARTAEVVDKANAAGCASYAIAHRFIPLKVGRVCETLNPSSLSGVSKRRSESSVINAGRSLRGGKKNQRASASAKLAGGTPNHRRSHSSTATTSMPILQKTNPCKPTANQSAKVVLALGPVCALRRRFRARLIDGFVINFRCRLPADCKAKAARNH